MKRRDAKKNKTVGLGWFMSDVSSLIHSKRCRWTNWRLSMKPIDRGSARLIPSFACINIAKRLAVMKRFAQISAQLKIRRAGDRKSWTNIKMFFSMLLLVDFFPQFCWMKLFFSVVASSSHVITEQARDRAPCVSFICKCGWKKHAEK